jgi:hypothetical protein
MKRKYSEVDALIQVGTRFGRLVVVDPKCKNAKGYNTKAKCLCDCGKEKIADRSALIRNLTKSCGCYRAEITGKLNYRHGHAVGRRVPPEYMTWSNMKDRCHNTKSEFYYMYGGRGITVCPQWQHSFEVFLSDVGLRPSSDHSLDRINPDGNYEPGNVRWLSPEGQANNRRCVKMYTFRGMTKSVAEWSRIVGTKYTTIRTRIEHGWTPYDAIFMGWNRRAWRQKRKALKSGSSTPHTSAA